MLSEMMANTTFPEIVNEIKGASDSVVPTDTLQDYIRKVEVTDVEVAFVKMSNERESKLYETSVIVVAKSKTSGAAASWYSVTRYWQDISSSWIKSELLFELIDGPYSDVFVFDKYAITIKNENIVNAVYYSNFRGKFVPANYEMAIYNDL